MRSSRALEVATLVERCRCSRVADPTEPDGVGVLAIDVAYSRCRNYQLEQIVHFKLFGKGTALRVSEWCWRLSNFEFSPNWPEILPSLCRSLKVNNLGDLT